MSFHSLVLGEMDLDISLSSVTNPTCKNGLKYFCKETQIESNISKASESK